MNFNKAVVLGNITKDPELKTTPSGAQVCSFSIATNRAWFNKNTNEKQTEVEFHNIVAWGKTAQLVAQYMRRGSQILIEGRLQTRMWESQDGKKNYRTEVVVENMQFGAKPARSAPAPYRQESAPSNDFEASLQPVDAPPASSEQSDGDINVEDIPF